ncbi:MAG: rRNA pseudouridine synthase [Candidatus Omnitrophica bacterium]|nr:rRNA pseudouridine synthase [Candidatus Omnitrophota bacterium]
MRLQVYLSKAGISSRRQAAVIIKSGKIRINDRSVSEPSFKVDPEKDKVYLNNERIFPREKVYIMLHKPGGVTTTKKDPYATMTVMDCLPQKFSHLNPVGRLDKDTTGLTLLTNDGKLINKLTHPRFNIEKIYVVKLDRRLKQEDRARLEKGIRIEERCTAPCRIILGEKSKLEITLHEGRKRQIKRMFAKLGYKVKALKRIKEGALDLGTLPTGRWRFLTEEELAKIR